MSNENKCDEKIIDLGLASIDCFQHYIGETFYLHRSNGATMPLVLHSAKEHPRTRRLSAPPEVRMPFSLSFSGDKDGSLMTENVRLVHDQAGTLEGVAIVQVLPQQGLADPKSWYEIVFN